MAALAERPVDTEEVVQDQGANDSQDALAAASANAIHLNTADGDSEPLQLQSLCMRCHETGTTTMLLVSIPHFKDLLIASFECPDCGFRNSEVQFAGAYGECGTRHTLRVAAGHQALLGRQIVKSTSATVMIPELQFEIPPLTQKGVITTIEGLITEATTGLRALQEERTAADPAAGAAVEAVLQQLDACAAAERDFTIVIDDPAGCSHLEPGDPGDTVGTVAVEYYDRTPEQAEALGLSAAPGGDDDAGGGGGGGGLPSISEQEAERAADVNWDVHHGAPGQRPVGAPGLAGARGHGIHVEGAAAAASLVSKFAAPEEVVELPGHCYACGAACDTRMFTTAIPHFKDVIIMSNACDTCGYRDSEVKPGGGFSDLARRITLQVSEAEDLRRDVIKSDTADIYIPELDLQMSTGSLGGLITTVEGLLTSVQESFKRMHSFHLGDSAVPDHKKKYSDFFTRLNAFANLEEPWTLVISDPLANSFVAPVTADMADDGRLSVQDFERSPSDDEEYGIDHLKLHEDPGQKAERQEEAAAERRELETGHQQWGKKDDAAAEAAGGDAPDQQ